MHTILIVEDDAVIAQAVGEELAKWGYAVTIVKDFNAVMETFRTVRPHLVLLDLSLPYRNGFHWCAEIRKETKTPILFISSAASNMNMVTALHQGADDFIAKPFDLSVLIAKVQAVLRRSYEFIQMREMLSCGELLLYIGSMELSYQGNTIALTKNEFRILQILIENAEKVCSREMIMRKLWDDESFVDDNTLTVNINRLRRKLEAAGLKGAIVTKKGEGYQLAVKEKP